MEAVPSSIEAARWREYHQRNPMKKQHKVMPLFHQTVHKSIMQQKNLKRNNQSAKNDTIPQDISTLIVKHTYPHSGQQ